MDNQPQGSKPRVSEGEFRHYVFDAPELLAEAQRFLLQAGYELKPISYIGLVEPDFRAKRKTDSTSHEVVGILRQSIDEAVEGLVKLAAIRAVKRDIDCVLVLPPINEYLLIEFLMEEKGRWYFGMKDCGLMVWFCNPDNHTTMCVIGGPADRDLPQHFFMGEANFDAYMTTRGSHLITERLLAEEEEED
ncbi:hypothetical protein ACFLXE_01465 [Chloroflexota bacterium]